MSMPAEATGREQIPNYLVPAILTTLFCFWPTGIAAIIFAAQVNGKQAQGDIAGARASSQKAKTFSIVSAVIGAVVIALILVFVVFAGNNQ